MRSQVGLPRRDGLADEFEFILSRGGLLVHPDGEVVHLSGIIGEGFFLPERVVRAAHGDGKQIFAALHALRDNDGAELIAVLEGDGARLFHCAIGLHHTIGQADDSLAHGVFHQYVFLQLLPLAVGKSVTFLQGHAGIGHAVVHRQADDALCRGYFLGFAPEEVAGFVASQVVAFGSFRLVFLDGEFIGVHVGRRAERVVAVDVDGCVVVFPIDVVGRVPFVGRFVEGVFHVRAAVACVLKYAGRVSFVVHDVDAHLVAVAETVVIDTADGELFDFARERDGHLRRSFCSESIFVLTTAEHACQQGQTEDASIKFVLFHIRVYI